MAFGIGLQNFPEGTKVSMPLRREGMGEGKSLLLVQASGMVESVAGGGALFVVVMQSRRPYVLCFSAGAMIFVVVEELIPGTQPVTANIDLVTMSTMACFSLMLLLEVSLR